MQSDNIDTIKQNFKHIRKLGTEDETFQELLEKYIQHDKFPSSPIPNNKVNKVVYSIITYDRENTSFIDLTE